MKSFFTLMLLVLTLQACNRPECKSANPVFNNSPSESLEYKRELVRYLQGNPKGLTYWVEGYVEKDHRSFVDIWIQNDELCARALMEIREPGQLPGIVANKGVGYRGAELKGLEYDLIVNEDDVRIIFKYVDEVID